MLIVHILWWQCKHFFSFIEMNLKLVCVSVPAMCVSFCSLLLSVQLFDKLKENLYLVTRSAAIRPFQLPSQQRIFSHFRCTCVHLCLPLFSLHFCFVYNFNFIKFYSMLSIQTNYISHYTLSLLFSTTIIRNQRWMLSLPWAHFKILHLIRFLFSKRKSVYIFSM